MNSIKNNFLALSIILFSALGHTGLLLPMEKETEYELSDHDNSEYECCGCLDEINLEHSDNIIVFECNHYLCNKCFEEWQQKGNTCPTCRGTLDRAYRTFKDVRAHEEIKDLRKQIEQLQNEIREQAIKNAKSSHTQDEKILMLCSEILRRDKTVQKQSDYSDELLKQMQQLTIKNTVIKLRLKHDEKEKEETVRPQQKSINHTAALYEAIRNDSSKEIRQAVMAGADVNCKIAFNTPLLLSIIYKKPNALIELLKLNATFEDSYIRRAIELGDRPGIVRLLKQHKALNDL